VLEEKWVRSTTWMMGWDEAGEKGGACTGAERNGCVWREGVRYLEELLDYEGRLDGGDAARRD
jgi:hypothetical protein